MTRSASRVLADIKKYLKESREARGEVVREGTPVGTPLTKKEYHYINQLIADWYEQHNRL